MSAVLYVVGTPIGNLGDLSPRAIDAFENCDFIAAEDTRVTLKLLNSFGIKKPMISYHEHNRFEMSPRIVARLMNGESCVLVTDAGMPAISDPGEDLVRMCHEHGIKVESVPGPTAFATAMAISGMPSGRFTFEGFLSVNKASRTEHIQSIVKEPRTMIFYEAPHKLKNTLADLYKYFGDRKISLCRDAPRPRRRTRRQGDCNRPRDNQNSRRGYPHDALRRRREICGRRTQGRDSAHHRGRKARGKRADGRRAGSRRSEKIHSIRRLRLGGREEGGEAQRAQEGRHI